MVLLQLVVVHRKIVLEGSFRNRLIRSWMNIQFYFRICVIAPGTEKVSKKDLKKLVFESRLRIKGSNSIPNF